MAERISESYTNQPFIRHERYRLADGTLVDVALGHQSHTWDCQSYYQETRVRWAEGPTQDRDAIARQICDAFPSHEKLREMLVVGDHTDGKSA